MEGPVHDHVTALTNSFNELVPTLGLWIIARKQPSIVASQDSPFCSKRLAFTSPAFKQSTQHVRHIRAVRESRSAFAVVCSTGIRP
jgi:hypothetical protein